MENERLTYTTSEIQKVTGLGRDHVNALIREGKFPNVGTTKRFVVPRVAVTRYLEQAGQNNVRR